MNIQSSFNLPETLRKEAITECPTMVLLVNIAIRLLRLPHFITIVSCQERKLNSLLNVYSFSPFRGLRGVETKQWWILSVVMSTHAERFHPEEWCCHSVIRCFHGRRHIGHHNRSHHNSPDTVSIEYNDKTSDAEKTRQVDKTVTFELSLLNNSIRQCRLILKCWSMNMYTHWIDTKYTLVSAYKCTWRY